ncbi:MAG TPA: cytochrome c biogenesis protein CcsA [Polyangia bacterium]|jgi:ABC-type uncharacterized transport system permease subunit
MITSLIAGGLYVAAAGLYLVFVWGQHERLARLARLVLVAAAVGHAVDIAAHCVHGAHPASSAREAVNFAAFVMVATYLALSWRYRLAAVGGLVAPAAVMLVIAARVTPLAARPAGFGTLGRVHIILAVLGVALFAIAALASALYLVQAKQLKRKEFGTLFHRGPPLEQLDTIVQRCVNIGFPVFTVALLLGALWMARLGGDLKAMPQYLLALVTWFAFAGLLLSRAVAGWHGRRSALLAIFGFTTSLAVMVLYLLRAVLRA